MTWAVHSGHQNAEASVIVTTSEAIAKIAMRRLVREAVCVPSIRANTKTIAMMSHGSNTTE